MLISFMPKELSEMQKEICQFMTYIYKTFVWFSYMQRLILPTISLHPRLPVFLSPLEAEKLLLGNETKEKEGKELLVVYLSPDIICSCQEQQYSSVQEWSRLSNFKEKVHEFWERSVKREKDYKRGKKHQKMRQAMSFLLL